MGEGEFVFKNQSVVTLFTHSSFSKPSVIAKHLLLRNHLLCVSVCLLQGQMSVGTGRWWMLNLQSRTLVST